MTRQDLVDQIADLLHVQDDPIAAAKLLVQTLSLEVKGEITFSAAQNLLLQFLEQTLELEDYYNAAKLCWTHDQFSPEPQSTRDIWRTYESSDLFLLMGAASMSKSFSIAVRLLLEWVRDPKYTSVNVLGPSEEHLESNFFSHLVELHRGSRIRLPGEIGQRYIGLDKRARRGAIRGIVVPIGKAASGRLQGQKRFPRLKRHPKFGKLSRLIIFMDEVNKIPVGIWKDVDNIVVNIQGDGGFKLGGAFNPQDISDEVAQRTEPDFGWKDLDPDLHFSWKSKRGWQVLRLDAYKCENVIEKKNIFPGLQTWEGMQAIIKNAGGYNTPGYYSMVRAMYPPTGTNFTIIAPGLLHESRGVPLWASSVVTALGVDLALEGSDRAVVARGEWGAARGIKRPPSVEHPNGHEEIFRKGDKPITRNVLHLTGLITMPRNATIDMGVEIRKLAQKLAAKPAWVAIDRTGNGQGVFDWLKVHWSPQVRGVNFYESASSIKIMDEDEKTPKEEYDRVLTELWFALQKFLEFGYLIIDPSVDSSALFPQLTGRRFLPGAKTKVEAKKEYMSRGNTSPNEADAVSLLVHAVRMESLVGLGMEADMGVGESNAEPWSYYDITNGHDYL